MDETPRLTPAAFEARASVVMSLHYGVTFTKGRVGSVHKEFDFVDGSRNVVGDAKYYTLVRGVQLPPAKFSVIAEHVWLLEHTAATDRFLVFGNDRRVPERWLHRFGNLAHGVAFYFLAADSTLHRLN